MLVWSQFLAARNIPYHEAGRHEIVIQCPFCGSSDLGRDNMSISTRGRGVRCFRTEAHSSKSYVRVIKALLGCTENEARELLGENRTALPTEDSFSTTWRRQLNVEPTVSARPTDISLPREFKPLLFASGEYVKRYWNYLANRGFSWEACQYIVGRYRLHYSVNSEVWDERIIIPLYNAVEKLVSWTGRALSKKSKPRYKNLHHDASVESPADLVLGMDFLSHVSTPRCLVITEGPFDAMAITALGHSIGVWGTCLFGLQISDNQAVILHDLARKFTHTRLLLDSDARLKGFKMNGRLPRQCEVRELPEGLKDPGELPAYEHGRDFVLSLR